LRRHQKLSEPKTVQMP